MLKLSAVGCGEVEVLVSGVDYPYYDSANALAEKADYIFHGKVIDKAYEWRVTSIPAAELYLNPEDVPPIEEDLVTVYAVQVLDTYLPSTQNGETIEVLMMGGETDTAIYTFEGKPELYVDSEYVFFLSKSSFFENAGWLLNPSQLVYLVEGTSISPVKGGFSLRFDWLESLAGEENETPEEEPGRQEPPLTITANGETIAPYLHFACSASWEGENFLFADGAGLVFELEDLVADGLIPQVAYTQDFGVILGDGITTNQILLFDEAFNQLEMLWDISDLAQLDAGEYYVGIVATKHGDYIEEVDKYESTAWDCVFHLTVSA